MAIHLSSNDSRLEQRSISRRRFVQAATLAGVAAMPVSLLADDQPKRKATSEHKHEDDHAHEDEHGKQKGYFNVDKLPFHLQHEFSHAISCNNALAKATEVKLAGENQHAIAHQPGTFGWGTITFFLRLDHSLVGMDMMFFSTVGWTGKAEGDVIFSVEINGDIIIDGARSVKNKWLEISRTLPVRTEEMRVTLMLDSIRGDNDFSFWWGEPQLMDGAHGDAHKHEHDEQKK